MKTTQQPTRTIRSLCATILMTLACGGSADSAILLADSVADFSGTQGADNWLYGYYDRRDDVENGDGAYSASDLIAFLNDGSGVVSADPAVGGWQTSPNHWDGGKWDLLNNGAPVSHGPWTEITQTSTHPAANGQTDGAVHWTVRRWVNPTVSSPVSLDGVFSNGSAGGDGTIGRIFHNGVEIFSGHTDGSPTNFSVTPTLSPGDILDFVSDPDGTGMFDGTPSSLDLINDGADGTAFNVTITQIPEPSVPVALLIAFGLLSRRRRP